MDRVLEYMMDNAADREVWDMADQGKKTKSNQQYIFTLKKALGYTGGKLDTLHKSQLR